MTRDEIMAMDERRLVDEVIEISDIPITRTIYNDLDLIWQLEEAIPAEQRREYTNCLNWVTCDQYSNCISWRFAHASPKDRCRAYLMWKEGV